MHAPIHVDHAVGAADRVSVPGDNAATSFEDCWNRTGIRGDRSCSQLAGHVHCRNCPVYARAAQRLLDAATIGDEAGAVQATPPATQATPPGQSLMVFRLGAEFFALPTRRCVEVVEARAIHTLPHRRAQALLGLASIRGQLTLCLSLAILLSVAPGALAAEARSAAAGLSRARLLLAGWPEGTIAFAVDEVLGVQSPSQASRSDAPATVGRATSRLVASVFVCDVHTVGLLDEEQLHRAVQRSLA